MSHEKTAIKTTWFSILGNGLLAMAKALAGIFGNSFALIADAIESATDILGSILVLAGLKYSNRPADKNHPYGHGRIEPLITFIVVGLLLFSSGIIAHESIKNIQTPHKAPETWTLFILGTIIAWKEISYQVVIKKSKETNSSALRADAWHHRSDALSSVAAFLGISVSLIMGPGYETADDWAALIASAIILYNSYLIFRPALGELLDEHYYDELILQIREFAMQVPGIKGTEKCFVRKAGLKYHIDLHARVNGKITVTDGHEIAHRLKDYLREKLPQLGHVLIHVEPDPES